MTRLLTRSVLLVGALALALALCEGALRITGLSPADHGVFTMSEDDFGRLPGIWEPGQAQVVVDHVNLPYRVTTNTLGFRGDEIPANRPAGEFRILFLGDSFTFGSYVDDAETAPARLEAHLASCGPVRVVNGGLGGSTITEQLPMLERGLVLEPDMVVLQFSENDVTDLGNTPMWEQLRQNREAKSEFPFSLFYRSVRRTAIWGVALRARAVLAARRSTTPENGLSDRIPAVSIDTLRARYESLASEFVKVAQASGAEVVFLVYPSHLSLYGYVDRDQVIWVRDFAAAQGVLTLDLTAPLATTGEPQEVLYLLPDDGHPSPMGYEVTSGYVAGELRDHPVLAARCGAD